MIRLAASRLSMGVCLAAWLLSTELSPGYSPDSPRVKEIVTRAVVFLETDNVSLPYSNSLGAKCLRGLACYKYYQHYGMPEAAGDGQPSETPNVLDGVTAVREYLAGKTALNPGNESYNYNVGLAIIFLCEIESPAKKFPAEINGLLRDLFDNQRADGSWSYQAHAGGDTSQTQYGILSAWYAQNQGYQVPEKSVSRSIAWLIRTQSSDGAFCYQPKDPGIGQPRMQQLPRLTMSPAGLGCLYIAAQAANVSLADEAKDAPAVFRAVTSPAKDGRDGTGLDVDESNLRRAIREGNRYYDAHFQLDVGRNFHYYLYSLERYQSLKSAAGPPTKVDLWYDKGVEFLAATQAANGSWDGARAELVSTSFALLFLLRSMEGAVNERAQGNLIGGHLLPMDLTNLTSKVIASIRSGVAPELAYATEAIDKIVLSDGDADAGGSDRKASVNELRRLLESANYAERVAAARKLADTADFRDAPHLIFALTDGDDRVTRAARDGLRLISRRFAGFGLPDQPSSDAKHVAAEKWQAWYQATLQHSIN